MGRSRPHRSLAEQIRNGGFQPEVDPHTGRSHPVRHSSDRRADPQQCATQLVAYRQLHRSANGVAVRPIDSRLPLRLERPVQRCALVGERGRTVASGRVEVESALEVSRHWRPQDERRIEIAATSVDLVQNPSQSASFLDSASLGRGSVERRGDPCRAVGARGRPCRLASVISWPTPSNDASSPPGSSAMDGRS